MRETAIWREGLHKTLLAEDTPGSRTGDQDPAAAPTCSVRVDATPKEVGRWMASRLQEGGLLYQRRIVREIAEHFGDEFTYLNGNGNLAIDKRVLKAFRQAPGGPPVWVRPGLYWRARTKEEVRDTPSV